MKKIIQGNNSSENKPKGNILDYIATKKYQYEDGPKPSSILNEIPILQNKINGLVCYS